MSKNKSVPARVFHYSALLYLIILAVVSLLPSTPTSTFTWADKVVHVVLYALLATVLERSGWFQSKTTVVFIAFGYGVLMEFLQHLTPYRTFDWWDVVANTIGVLIWLSISQAISKRKYKK